MEFLSANQYLNIEKSLLEEFVKIFIKTLEYEIIPKIIMQVELPTSPSIFKIKSHELISKRIPKIAEGIYDMKDPYKKSILIQDLANLKEEFNGHEVNETSPSIYKPIINYNTELYEILKLENEIPNSLFEFVSQQISISDLFELDIIEKDLISSNKLELGEVPVSMDFLRFDDDIKNKILTDNFFMKFINQIEISLIKFMKMGSYSFNGHLHFESDFEILDLKKIILSININGMNIQEKLDFWDQIDDFLRNNIEEFEKFLSIEQANKISEYNKIFYTNVELN